MGLSSSVKKPRGVVLQQQTSCYQRHIFVLLGLGLGSVLVYIYFTDHIQHALLPRLKAEVKRTVCSVMTLPCPEEGEGETGERGFPSTMYDGERIRRNWRRGDSSNTAAAEMDEMNRRKKKIDNTLRQAASNPVLRVRSRNPWLGINRGRGIGPIPTWKILQKIRGLRSGFRTQHQDSKPGQRFNVEFPNTNQVSSEGDEFSKEHERNFNQYNNDRSHQTEGDAHTNPKPVGIGDTYIHRNDKTMRKTATNLNQRSRQTPGVQEKQIPDDTRISQDGHTTNKVNNLQGHQDIQPFISQRHEKVNFKPQPHNRKDQKKQPVDRNLNHNNRISRGEIISNNENTNTTTINPPDISRANGGSTRESNVESKARKEESARSNYQRFSKTFVNKTKKNRDSPHKSSHEAQNSEKEEISQINSHRHSGIRYRSKSMKEENFRSSDQTHDGEENETSQEATKKSGQKSVQNDDKMKGETLSLDPEWTGKSLKAFLADRTSFSIQSDYDYLQQHLLSGGLNLTLMSTQQWPEEMRFDYKNFHNDPPLNNVNQAASHVTSHVVLLEPRPSYTVGEVLNLRVDVYNGNGDALTRGGDEVRVWLVERSKGASLAGIVTDLNNGSYLAELKLQWTGEQQIQAELTFSRETLRAHDYLRHVTKVMRYIAGGFSKGVISEATLCSPFPVIPGYDHICDYTNAKYGQTRYCGKPRKAELQCEDWVSIRDMEFFSPLPLTQAEQKLLESLRKPPHLRLIPAARSLSVKVTEGRAQMPSKPCSRIHAADTWHLAQPRGFMLHGHWVRTDCATGRLDAAMERACLTNTTLTFAGDSTLLQFFTDLVPRTGCALLEAHVHNWHRPRACVKPDIGFQMSWALHGYPVHPVSDHWALKTDFREVTDLLDAIPADGTAAHNNDGVRLQDGNVLHHQQHQQQQQTQQQQQSQRHRHVVLISLFIHLSIHHVNVFGQRMRAVRMAVERLLERSPSTLVLVRGPHTAYHGWPPHLGGDMMGPVIREIIVEEFRPLRDKVVYLDFWDMTVAMENSNFHPDPPINTAMLNAMLHHMCVT